MNRRPGSASDPLWYKDAIIYELHVKAFNDSNDDGIGDFPGLMQKLDYLQSLGITCIWLLPFFPSPLRDDGYDIADYMNVHPSYGTMEQFKAFLNAAHERDLQVLIELVINHTSDQHPWFQAARNAPPGSPERDYYVWSDTGEEYKDARIIFTDTEKSNWTWDPVAKAYFWHRFFSHQPDLNFDNPRVLEEVLKVMRFWLDLGVDGARLDAIPYLIERDGTNCENLPDTHVLIKKIRAAMDESYANRMILAEANQWPSDVRPYFGEGDECHMAFHFPVMPRIYMALRQEDRLPIVEIMNQTPDIPPSCQWGMFLRNHDELTLEMVTNDERDYMYLAYSADPRTRINLGIRRRLAPLLDNNRRRIELLNSLLFSLPGTPILYYGDEIGMGDNVYLGDRNGVRTPMQWNSDRNAGFSRANPAMLYSPVIMDPVWGYQALNVEAQQSDPSSLLNWMRNMIALRKLFRVFGRGTLEFLAPANRKILAYVRQFDAEQILCVTNLSRFAQPVDLDLSEFAGMTPVEMLGYVEFPAITRDPYRLTLGPYGFIWLELQGTPDGKDNETATTAKLTAHSETLHGWAGLMPDLEESILREFLPKQTWFRQGAPPIRAAKVVDWAEVEQAAILFIEVEFEDSASEMYVAPLLMHGDTLQDALQDEAFCAALLRIRDLRSQTGRIVGDLPDVSETIPVQERDTGANSSLVIYDNRFAMKLWRRQQEGPDPDAEVSRYLSEETDFEHVAKFAGSITYQAKSGAKSGLAVLHHFVQNEGDGWTWTTEELARYFESCSGKQAPEDPQAVRDAVGAYADSASMLGVRTAEMHLALARGTRPEFAPEPLGTADVEALVVEAREAAVQAFECLKRNLPQLPDDSVQMAGLALTRRKQIVDRILSVPRDRNYGQRIRIHQNYHLGKVLRTRNDFTIIGFDGELSVSLAQRRAKSSPLKDVAAMLRSLSYAAHASLIAYVSRRPDDLASLEPWARLWERTVAAEFLGSYRDAASAGEMLPPAEDDFRKLLDIHIFEKASRELIVELTEHPAQVRIPLSGILGIAG